MLETKLYTPYQINEDASIKTNSGENPVDVNLIADEELNAAQLDLSASPRASSQARLPTVDAINNMFSISGTICTINKLS